MLLSYLRPLLLVVGGAAVGGLVAWGLLSRSPKSRPTTAQATPIVFPHASPAVFEKENDPELLSPATVTPTPETLEPPAAIAVPMQTPPMAPARPPLQSNGLPLGVSPDAVNMDIYKRLPGVQPPLVNRDGRDLGPEAIQMLQTNHPEVPFPGLNPNGPVTPLALPKTPMEAFRQMQQMQQYSVPSPTP